MVAIPNLVKDWITKSWRFFPLLAFVIPLMIRAIPEILMGPYIVGFDTMGVYVPDTLLWLHNGINVWAYLQTAPLFYTIFISIVAAGGSPVWALKIIPPLLLGFLGLAIYVYARKGLDWSPAKSIVPAFLGTIYFVAFRISWDMLRNEIGLIFLFVVMTLLTNFEKNSWKRYFMLSLAMVAVVLSHQLVSVIMFGVIAVTFARELFSRHHKSAKMIVASLPSVLLFVIVYLSYATQYGLLDYSNNTRSPLASWVGFPSYPSMLINEVGFFLYCFSFLLPLVVVSFRGLRNLQLRSWVFFSFILLLLPLASVSPFRWILMLTYPLAFYATDALTRLKSIKFRRCKFNVYRIAVFYLVVSVVVLSFGYTFMSPEVPFPYFDSQKVNYFPYQIPSSMLQNTLSITDCQNTANVLQWFKNNSNNTALLLTHTAFYGWALLTLDEEQVSYYEFGDPLKAAVTSAQDDNTQVYLIWWTNGHGWYGQPNLSNSFRPIYRSGEIAIYLYESITPIT